MTSGSFGWALHELQTGHWVYREYWEHEDKHIELVVDGDIQHKVFHLVSDTGFHERWIYTPSQQDLLALDWGLVNQPTLEPNDV